MSVEANAPPAGWEVEESLGAGFLKPRPIQFVRGEGARLFDSAGESYLDVSASFGVASLGHAHPEVARAVAEQASRLIALTPAYSSDVRAEYLAVLAGALPSPLGRIFLCNSGTEAIEAALKVARLATGRTEIVALSRAFHGRTFGALSATADARHRDGFGPLVPGFVHVPAGDGARLAETIGPATAALIVEVVQGEGGVRPLERDYLELARALCDRSGALLIVDEVQTGFGRTGSLFACEGVGLAPDVLCLGKGIAGGVAMGATAFGPRVGALPPGAHGSTFGGNPLACAAALATLRVLRRDRLAERAAELGRRALERLAPLAGGKQVREVRGRGLMIGIELRGRVAPVLDQLLERRIVALGAGPNVLRLLPPLVIGEADLDRVTGELLELLA